MFSEAVSLYGEVVRPKNGPDPDLMRRPLRHVDPPALTFSTVWLNGEWPAAQPLGEWAAWQPWGGSAAPKPHAPGGAIPKRVRVRSVNTA